MVSTLVHIVSFFLYVAYFVQNMWQKLLSPYYYYFFGGSFCLLIVTIVLPLLLASSVSTSQLVNLVILLPGYHCCWILATTNIGLPTASLTFLLLLAPLQPCYSCHPVTTPVVTKLTFFLWHHHHYCHPTKIN